MWTGEPLEMMSAQQSGIENRSPVRTDMSEVKIMCQALKHRQPQQPQLLADRGIPDSLKGPAALVFGNILSKPAVLHDF